MAWPGAAHVGDGPAKPALCASPVAVTQTAREKVESLAFSRR
jgi:hypothetical protein